VATFSKKVAPCERHEVREQRGFKVYSASDKLVLIIK